MKRYLFLLFFLFFCLSKGYGQEIEQFQVFAGRFDYTAFGNTLNLEENGIDINCEVLTSSAATFQLDQNQTIVAAYLYWAGSGTGDFEVVLNEQSISAERTFSDQIDDERVFFAAFADVTNILQTQGVGLYTLSDLDVTDVIDPFCPTGTNFAGWAVTVIFEDSNLPLNVVNVFDGLESVSALSNELSIELENLNVLDNENARIGFIAWEGDAGLAVDETLSINGNVLSNPPLNPANNQFNGTNSFTGADDLFNMDIDVYSIENNINVGDTSATIALTSGQDFVMINSIVTVLNSQIPDAIITIDNTTTACESRDITITYTVENIGTDILPINTPITFYINDLSIETAFSTEAILIGDSLTQTITLSIPESFEDEFTLLAIVDDLGTGTGIINEINEGNNESMEIIISLTSLPIEIPLLDLTSCDTDGDGLEIFDLSIIGDAAIAGDPTIEVSYHLSESDAMQNINPIGEPQIFLNDASELSIFLRFTSTVDDDCLQIEQANLSIISLPSTPVIAPLLQCDDVSNDGIGFFDLTPIVTDILNNQPDAQIAFFENENDAILNQNNIELIDNYQSFPNQELLYVRISTSLDLNCFIVTQFQIGIQPADPTVVLPNLTECNEGFEIATFDLSLIEDFLNTSGSTAVSGYYITEEDAFQDRAPIQDIFEYQNLSNPQTIFIRTDLNDGSICPQFSQFNLLIENCPPFIPEGFSPNNDGINEEFEISGLKDVFPEYQLRIYSRLGNLIYEGDNEVPFWDGTPNRGISGSQVPTGVYFWVLQLNDIDLNDRTGWVYLNR